VLIVTAYVAPADAQLQSGEEGCIIKEFRENAYAPFRIIMIGDPAIQNEITDLHTDDGSRWQLDRSEFEGDVDSPSVVNFFTESIDDWKWTVRQSFRIEAVEPRPITIAYQSNNVEFQRETFYRTGFDFCIIYQVSVREAPHIFTEAEILETADKIQEENFAVVGDQIARQIKEVISTKNFTIAVAVLQILVFIILIITFYVQTRGSKQLKNGLKQERNFLSVERGRMDIKFSQIITDIDKWKKDIANRFDGFFSLTETKVNSILLEIENIKETIPGLTNEVSSEFIGPLQPDVDIIQVVRNKNNEIIDEYDAPKRLFDPKTMDPTDQTPISYMTINTDHVSEESLKTILREIELSRLPPVKSPVDFEPKPEINLDDALPRQKTEPDLPEQESSLAGKNIDDIKGFATSTSAKVKTAFGIKKRPEVPEEMQDEIYWIQWYREKLKNFDELSDEYKRQNVLYSDQTNEPKLQLATYYKLKALQILMDKDDKYKRGAD